MLMNLVKNEFKKEKRNLIILFVLAIPIAISALLCIDFLIRYESWLLPQGNLKGFDNWQILIKEQRILYFNDNMPLFASLILVTLFESEYKNNSWTFLLTKPIKRSQILTAKFITAGIYALIMLLINIFSLIGVGFIFKFKEPIPWRDFMIMFGIQLIATLAIMTIHLFINIKHKNMLVSIGIAFILSKISSNLYYNESPISKVNPYDFSLFSISHFNLSPGSDDVRTALLVSAGILLIGSILVRTYFKNKEIY